jgi:hypothetical protein
MNKREVKKLLKAYLARRIWYDDVMQEDFLVISGLVNQEHFIKTGLPQTPAAAARFQNVIIELREEWINDD